MRKIVLLLLGCGLPVHAEIFTLEMDREKQQLSQLCWAAVSVMATRAFNETSIYRHATQEEVVVYKRANLGALLPLGTTSLPQVLVDANTDCIPLFKCNAASLSGPWLLGLDSSRVVELAPGGNMMLSEGHFSRDIGDRERPILIQWVYTVTSPTPLPTPNGAHALIVTGYDDEKHEVRVWDPWPAVGMTEPPPGMREKWIPFTRYALPRSDEGVAVQIAASHEFDEFDLRRNGRPDDLATYPALVPIPPIPNPPEIVDFDGGIPDAGDAVNEYLHGHEMRDRDGKLLPGPFTAGDVIPIVGIRTEQLLRARSRPDSLLIPKTSAIVVPVLQGQKVVDSFLLLKEHGKWHEDGYSNNVIAHVLSELRAKNTSTARPKSGFYLVSIPEQGEFYIAHGFQRKANLIPLDTNGPGDFVPARKVLGDLINRIDEAGTAKAGPRRSPTVSH